MLRKLDRYIILRLFIITLFVLAVLIFVFVVIDFSQKSDDFIDHGATFSQILKVYYVNYIPEIIRLVTPVAIFVATLLLAGQMADRLEIVAIKAAGISLYRLAVPYLLFGLLACIVISYLDGFVVPKSNAVRLNFEHRYMNQQSSDVSKGKIYREESPNSILMVNYFDPKKKEGYQVQLFRFKDGKIVQTLNASRMSWKPDKKVWHLVSGYERNYDEDGYSLTKFTDRDTTLNVMPLDLARSSSDVYQLTYPETIRYIHSLERSGASKINLPKVQFYSKLSYPFSIIVVILIGLPLAAAKNRGGRGVKVAYGLAISFLYLALMKISEPFGASGGFPPLAAALIPHAAFFITGIVLMLVTRK